MKHLITTSVLTWLGAAYLAYHAVAGALLLVMACVVEPAAGYCEDRGPLLVILLGPIFFPVIVVSGGPHNLGARGLGAAPLLLLMIVAAGSGVWLIARRLLRVLRG